MSPGNSGRTRKRTGQSAAGSTALAPPCVSSKSTKAKPTAHKRPADVDTPVVQPQSKRPRVGGTATRLHLVVAKGNSKNKEVRPPPNTGGEDSDSDNELISLFDDDEELGPSESEDDDTDQEVIVPQWTTGGEPKPRGKTHQVVSIEQVTPVWQQPLAAQTTVPSIGEVDQVPDQVDQPEVNQLATAPPQLAPHHQPPQPHPPPPNPQHALQLVEAHWPETARLVYPARGGKWALLAQNASIQAVVQDTIPLVFRHIASVDSFPSGGDKVRVTRDSLFKAAQSEGFDAIADRLSQDQNFGRRLSSLVDARASILRGDVRDAASAAIAAFRITDPEVAEEYLLQDLTYIYPIDPWSRKMQTDQPYRHPAIESIIRHIFFHGSSASTYDGIYHSSLSESDELEVPIPMVALSATAVHAALDDFGRNRGAFSASLYEDIYRRHVATLENIRTANVRAFHAITGSIYHNCMRRSGALQTIQPLTLNMAELSTTFD